MNFLHHDQEANLAALYRTVRVNVTTVLVSSTIMGSKWSNILRLWIHIKRVTSVSSPFYRLNPISQQWEISIQHIYTADMPLGKQYSTSLETNKLIRHEKDIRSICDSLLCPIHTVPVKPRHKLVEVRDMYFPGMHLSSKTRLPQIPQKNVRPNLTREERDDGAISVWTFLKVCHHLCRPLACVASHRRPVVNVSIPVDHCDYLPIIFIANIHPFFELHLRHCKNKWASGSKWTEISLRKTAFQRTWLSGKNKGTEVRTEFQFPCSHLTMFWR